MKWNKLPKKIEGQKQPHPYIKNSDICYYAREYNTGDKNFKSNQLIYNFKGLPQSTPKEEFISNLRDKEEALKNRKKAIKQISEEIAELLKPDSYTIIAMPSSKIKTDPKYDHRFEDLFEELLKLHPYLKIEEPVENKETLSDTRNPHHIKSNYIWTGWKKNAPEEIIIIDDVLTTGSHFRALSDFLEENQYKGKIIGLFLAKTYNPKYSSG